MLHQVVSTPASDPTQDPLVEMDITVPSAPSDPDAALSAAEESANAAASSAEISKDFNSLEIIDKARLRANRGLSSHKKYANEPSFLTIQNWCRARGFTHWTWQFFGLGYNPAQAESLWKDSDLARWGIVAQDLINAGLWVSRQWEKIEWRQANGTKDDISLSAETDNRIKLCGYRWVAGDCITVPVMHPRNPGQVMTWVNRRVGLPKTVREIAGDYRDDGPVIGKEQSLAIDDGRKYQYLKSPRKARIDKAGKLLDVAHQHVLWCPRWLDAYQESIPDPTAKEAWQRKKDEEARERGEVVKDRKVWSTMKDVSESAWLVEGVPDCMAASQSGALACTAGGAFVPEAAIKELLPELKLHDKFHRNIYVGFDADPVPAAPKPGKILRLGAGVQGMLDFGARLLALEPELALRLHFVFLPAGPGGEKNDFAEHMLGVYKTLPEPGNTKIDLASGSMEFPSGFFDPEWVAFHLQVMELQKAERERLESTAVSLPDAMIQVLEEVLTRQKISASQQMQALAEVGLLDLMHTCPDLWLLEMEDKVAATFAIPKSKRKAWAKMLSAKAAESVMERSAAVEDRTDPIVRKTRKDGTVEPCYSSVRALLKRTMLDPALISEVFGDEVTKPHGEAKTVVSSELFYNQKSLQPCLKVTYDDAKTKLVPIPEENIGDIQDLLACKYGCDADRARHLEQALIDLAMKRRINPVEDWIRALPEWEGVDHTPHLVAALGLTAEKGVSERDLMLYNTFVAKTLRAAVARALWPGIQVDHMFILQGGQGIRKSSWIKALLPDEDWYISVGVIDPKQKDTFLKMLRKWIIDVPEVDRKSIFKDAAEFKDLITTGTDSLRPPYMKETKDFPRTSIFMGSSNMQQFLRDTSGNRRFWICKLLLDELKDESIDVGYLRKNREQIWAQALHSVLKWDKAGRPDDGPNGFCWWLTFEEKKAHAAQVAQFQVDDLEADAVLEYLRQTQITKISGPDLAKGMGMYTDSSVGRKLSRILVEVLGWSKLETAKANDGNVYVAPPKFWEGRRKAETPAFPVINFDLDALT